MHLISLNKMSNLILFLIFSNHLVTNAFDIDTFFFDPYSFRGMSKSTPIQSCLESLTNSAKKECDVDLRAVSYLSHCCPSSTLYCVQTLAAEVDCTDEWIEFSSLLFRQIPASVGLCQSFNSSIKCRLIPSGHVQPTAAYRCLASVGVDLAKCPIRGNSLAAKCDMLFETFHCFESVVAAKCSVDAKSRLNEDIGEDLFRTPTKQKYNISALNYLYRVYLADNLRYCLGSDLLPSRATAGNSFVDSSEEVDITTSITGKETLMGKRGKLASR